MREISDREKWFIDRIGKIVFRNDNECDCDVCKTIYEEGVFIRDQDHASYLYEIEGEYNYDGWDLRYFDTKAEVLDYQNNLANKKINKP